jgi:hypothetical protein
MKPEPEERSQIETLDLSKLFSGGKLRRLVLMILFVLMGEWVLMIRVATGRIIQKTVVSWAETQICGFVSAGDNNLRIIFGFPWNMYVSKSKYIYICINNIINNKRIDRAAAVVCVPVDRLAGAWVGCKYAMSTPPLVALLP